MPRRRSDMHAVSLEVPRRSAPAELSFAAVAEDHLDDVYGYLLYLTKNWALAEDLTSETFETALRRWRRFDPRRGTHRSWLLAIARSTALDWFRADARRKRREERAEAARARCAGAFLRRDLLARARRGASRPHSRGARGRRATGRARPRRRRDRTPARNHGHCRLDTTAQGTRKAGREDETP